MRSLAKSCPVEKDIAPGVTLSGTFHPGSSGDRDTPGCDDYVDPYSLRIEGAPDDIALWILDCGVDPLTWAMGSCQRRAEWLEGMATELTSHHENQYHEN